MLGYDMITSALEALVSTGFFCLKLESLNVQCRRRGYAEQELQRQLHAYPWSSLLGICMLAQQTARPEADDAASVCQQSHLGSAQRHLGGAAIQPVFHGLAGAAPCELPAAEASHATNEHWYPVREPQHTFSISTRSRQ